MVSTYQKIDMIIETSGDFVSYWVFEILAICPIGNEVNTTEKSDYNEQYAIDDFYDLRRLYP